MFAAILLGVKGKNDKKMNDAPTTGIRLNELAI